MAPTTAPATEPTTHELWEAERAAYAAWVDAALYLAQLVEKYDTEHPHYVTRKEAAAAAHKAWNAASEKYFAARAAEASIDAVHAELATGGA